MTITPDEVPVHPTKVGKSGDLKRGKGQHLDSIENKRVRLGGPSCLPENWRNKDASSMIMSFDMPALKEGSMMTFVQANSQLPAFGRYTLECSDQERPRRVLDNPMGHEQLWAPQTASVWDVCRRDGEYKFDTAENHGECALCKGAKVTELVPCCWCTNWVHLRCSYAVPPGRACASHFDIQNPLEKQVVACKDDPLVPEHFRERPVFPSQAEKPTSMFKAMTMYPVWDKWIMPRCETIPQRYNEDPERWALSSIDDTRGPRETPPLGAVRWEYTLLDCLSHEQGNLFRIWYEDLCDYEKSFWHAFMQKAAQKQEYRWEDFRTEEPPPIDYEPVKNFDSRFFYYDEYYMISESLLHSTDRSTEEELCNGPLQTRIWNQAWPWIRHLTQQSPCRGKEKNLQLRRIFCLQLEKDRLLPQQREQLPSLQHHQQPRCMVLEFKKQPRLQ